ncbi:hypothetical protein HYO62_00395 [Aerococcaceae bacterium DSM 111022]|nr:hypothetical protein [Aerococcaceae bacterium DSM 111022]
METEVLTILKARLGISTTVRDSYLKAIIKGVMDELENQQGIKMDVSRNDHLMFLADYSEYRYSNRDAPNMPRHLQWRLHNLFVGGGIDVQ